MLDSPGSQPALTGCWLLPPTPPLFILLGRYGDIIQILPCWREIYRRTGFKPRVMVSVEYASVLEGVSYISPYVVRGHWWQGMPQARLVAESLAQNIVVPQWWNDDAEHARMIHESAKGNFVIQCHGIQWGVDTSKWPDYGTSMASRCGFTREEWLSLPLVFDRRSPQREEELWNKTVVKEGRPVVLYNFTGLSSPFSFQPEVINGMKLHFGPRFRFVDLGKVRAHRIYDLLGLYDRAVGLLTSDTATLHLAPASKTPYIAFCVGSWNGSVPKGNCDFACTYAQTPSNLPRVWETMERWAT